MKISAPDARRIFECPSCILRNMDPLSLVVDTLIQPQPLRQGQTSAFQFIVKEDQYNLIF
jgi:hypothetical protein